MVFCCTVIHTILTECLLNESLCNYVLILSHHGSSKSAAAPDTMPAAADMATLSACDKGLCLGVDKLGPGKRLKVKVQWVDERLFEVVFPSAPTCTPND